VGVARGHPAEQGGEVGTSLAVEDADGAVEDGSAPLEEGGRRDDLGEAIVEGRVLALQAYRQSFDSATDSGVFHVFDDDDRPRYEHSVRDVLRPGGYLFLVCFSERQPGDWGPRRVTQRELREVFSHDWHMESIEEAHFATKIDDAPQVEAWLAAITRL